MESSQTYTPQLFLAAHMACGAEIAFAGGSVAYFAAPSPDRTGPNEDAFALLSVNESIGVLVLADGCGGQANGQLASQLAVEALTETLAGGLASSGLRSPILDGFELAMQRVRQLGTGAATTLLAVEIAHGKLRTYHVGDSQAMLVSNRGNIKLLTQAHSPIGYAVESGMMSESVALEHEDRHLVSNLVGVDDAHIDVGLMREISPRDTLLLASDGLFDNLRIQEIAELIRKGPLLAALESVRSLASQRMQAACDPEATEPGKLDDLSLLLYRQN